MKPVSILLWLRDRFCPLPFIVILTLYHQFSLFSIFLLENNKIRPFRVSENPFRCMLFNNFNIYCLKCLRVRCAYTTPMFADFNM